MIKTMIRWQTILIMMSLVIVIIVIALSPFLPTQIGTLRAFGVDDTGNFGYMYLDLDTGLMAQEPEMISLPNANLPYNTILTSASTDDNITYYFTRSDDGLLQFVKYDDDQATIIREYDTLTIRDLAWETRYQSLRLVDSNSEDGTTIYSLDIETGNLSSNIQLPNFDTGFVRSSPNGRYLLLREVQENTYRSVVAPKPMMLIDLETSDIIEFGAPDFAYWSPDSTQLAIGYESDIRFRLDVSIYDIASGETTDLGLQTSHLDTPFFADFQSNGVLWSPDSQSLAIINQYEETLYFASLADEQIRTVTDSNLKPLSWSPDGAYLLTTGYYEDNVIGSYVIDFETASVRFIQSEHDIQTWNTTLLWSPNGRYISLSKSLSLPEPMTEITIFDTKGQMVHAPIIFDMPNGLNIISNSINWLDEH